MIERFQYHALAFGLSGHIDAPFEEIIPVQASCALPDTGGFGTACAGGFRFNDIVSFRSAHAVVAGSYSTAKPAPGDPSPEAAGSYDALATVVIEGLDILGVVSAERIVARIASSHPADGSEPSITPLGSHFDGLRICGYGVELDLANDTFSKLDTASKVRGAYQENKDGFRDEFNSLSLVGAKSELPGRVREHFPWHASEPTEHIPERNGIISCSLARGVGGLGRELKQFGHVIYARGFGVIRLAEFKITGTSRRITMLQVDLGSTPKGKVTGGGAEGNGSGW